jgi:CO/xanthine dehydrogenase Mo-binding subunit
MHQACNIENGAIVESNFDRFALSRIAEDPLTINIQFFPTAHWLVGMGHDRGTSVQAALADTVFQITGKRFRDLPLGQHDFRWG